MTKKSALASDLICRHRRILTMIADLFHHRKMDAATVQPAYNGAEFNVLRPIGKNGVTGRKNEGPKTWIEEMRCIQEADSNAFAELYAFFAPRVKAFLMKSGASPDVAEEVAQDVMATVWRKAKLFDPTKASVSTWIFTIARNRRIDLIRKERRPEPEDLFWGPEAEPDQEDTMALQQETAQLGEAMAKLPEKQRFLIEKAYFGDLSHSEIADETGLPLGTIKSRIRLALERLRHNMK